MSSLQVAAIAFMCMFSGALLGGFLRRRLPDRHLDSESRDVVKLGAGLIATMAALVLGLMVSSAKSTYDKVNDGITQNAANIAYFDRLLAQYGPETKKAREQMRQIVTDKIDRIWARGAGTTAFGSVGAVREDEVIGEMLRDLKPKDEEQRILKATALQVYGDGVKLRWALYTQLRAAIPSIFLVVLVFWFTLLFAIFGLLSPGNRTVTGVMFLCALSISGGIVLTLDMNQPFDSSVTVSSAPLKAVLQNLGR